MPLSGKELLKLAKKEGWQVIRVNGSHHRLQHINTKIKMTIPVHANKDLDKGLEKKLLQEIEDLKGR